MRFLEQDRDFVGRSDVEKREKPPTKGKLRSNVYKSKSIYINNLLNSIHKKKPFIYILKKLIRFKKKKKNS